MALPNRAFYILLFILSVVSVGACEEHLKATVCQLQAGPAAYNHKVIEVSGFVSHDFEDFTLFDPSCPSWPRVWLEYGGKSKSGTMYCCGVTPDRSRPKKLVVENTPVPLIVNDQFRAFDKAIQPPFRSGKHGAMVHATIVGRFFAGKRLRYSKGSPSGGYGHMGCCTLLAIQEINAADTQNRTDLDYGVSPDQPDVEKTGCGYQLLIPIMQNTAFIQSQQQEADAGKREWAFDDPQRVASDALIRLAKIDEGSIARIRQIQESQGRKVYELKPAGRAESYMIVVSRPYWLSFYSHDQNRVAWIVLAAYESSCGGKHPVTRIR